MDDRASGLRESVSERIERRLSEHVVVEKVFGDPIERHGQTIVPVAAIRMGGGGGSGVGGDDVSGGSGEGGGFGGIARPVGVFVLSEDGVSWRPAFDWTRAFVVGNLTAIAYFVTAWLTARSRKRSVNS